MRRSLIALTIVALLGAGVLSRLMIRTPIAHAAGPAGPVVVELFQSQGCSSCPPANANLLAIIDRPGVLALSFGVTYWDDLGWKDTFASPVYTQRQYDYAGRFGLSSVGTPGVVIDGKVNTTGLSAKELDTGIARAGPTTGRVNVTASTATVAAAPAPRQPAEVWLVRYDPRVQQIAIKRGENGGRTLPHRNTVRQLTRLGAWNGPAQAYPLPPAADPAWRTAVLVQTHGGPILAAGT